MFVEGAHTEKFFT